MIIADVTSAITTDASTAKTAARRSPRFDPAAGVQPLHPRILVEIEIADRLFDRSIFGLLQAFGELPGKHVFLRLLSFYGCPEFSFDGIGVLS